MKTIQFDGINCRELVKNGNLTKIIEVKSFDIKQKEHLYPLSEVEHFI